MPISGNTRPTKAPAIPNEELSLVRPDTTVDITPAALSTVLNPSMAFLVLVIKS